MNWHTNLKRGKRSFRKIIRHSTRYRYEFLANRQLEELNHDNTDTSAIIKRIIQAETRRAMFQRFNRYVNPTPVSNMNYLEIPLDDGHPKVRTTKWSRIDDVEEMNDHLTRYNRHHFSQAQNTPFTVAPLSTSLGHSGLTHIGDSITSGTYIPPPNMDPFTK